MLNFYTKQWLSNDFSFKLGDINYKNYIIFFHVSRSHFNKQLSSYLIFLIYLFQVTFEVMEYTKSFLNQSVYRCVTVVLCTVLTVCLLSFSLEVNRYKHELHNTEYQTTSHKQYCHIRRLNSSVDDILCMVSTECFCL